MLAFIENGQESFEIRPWKVEDAASLQKHADNIKIAENLRGRFPHPYTLEDAKAWIEFNLSGKCEPHKNFVIAVNGECVGSIGLKMTDDRTLLHTAEMGYWLGEDHWGKGIITKAIDRMLQFGFEQAHIKKIFACVFDPNKGSMRVLEKNGFKHEATRDRHCLFDGQLVDELIFCIWKSEYIK